VGAKQSKAKQSKAKQSKAKQSKRGEQGNDITIRVDDEYRTNLTQSHLFCGLKRQ
jgi:hypothetical protein